MDGHFPYVQWEREKVDGFADDTAKAQDTLEGAQIATLASTKLEGPSLVESPP
jgi:hypothetical protein